MNIRFRSTILALLLFPASVFGTERVLLPVVFGGSGAPGAYGSQWVTFVTGFNANDHYVPIVESLLPCSVLCPAPPAPARAVFRLDPYTPSGLGRYLYVGGTGITSAESDAVHLSLRAQDLSRQSETWGTELPVVRQRDYRDHITLLDVPTSGAFRVSLRIFAPDVERAIVRFEVYRQNDLVVDDEIAISPPVPGYEEYPPQIAINDLVRSYHQLAAGDPVRIVVSGQQPLWAFASATNNTTQHVTTMTPR